MHKPGRVLTTTVGIRHGQSPSTVDEILEKLTGVIDVPKMTNENVFSVTLITTKPKNHNRRRNNICSCGSAVSNQEYVLRIGADLPSFNGTLGTDIERKVNRYKQRHSHGAATLRECFLSQHQLVPLKFPLIFSKGNRRSFSHYFSAETLVGKDNKSPSITFRN